MSVSRWEQFRADASRSGFLVRRGFVGGSGRDGSLGIQTASHPTFPVDPRDSLPRGQTRPNDSLYSEEARCWLCRNRSRAPLVFDYPSTSTLWSIYERVMVMVTIQ